MNASLLTADLQTHVKILFAPLALAIFFVAAHAM
jgi:hypothetical protein